MNIVFKLFTPSSLPRPINHGYHGLCPTVTMLIFNLQLNNKVGKIVLMCVDKFNNNDLNTHEWRLIIEADAEDSQLLSDLP